MIYLHILQTYRETRQFATVNFLINHEAPQVWLNIRFGQCFLTKVTCQIDSGNRPIRGENASSAIKCVSHLIKNRSRPKNSSKDPSNKFSDLVATKNIEAMRGEYKRISRLIKNPKNSSKYPSNKLTVLDLIATKNVEPIRGEYEAKTCASPSSAKPPHFTMLVVENAHHVEKNQNILASFRHACCCYNL